MSCADYVVGQKPRFDAVFRLGQVLTDPDAVKFIYQREGAAAVVWVFGVDAGIVRAAAGRYHADLELDGEGWWAVRWESAGNLVSAWQRRFYVGAEDPVG